EYPGLGVEAGDHIVARFARADLVGELATAPMIELDLLRGAQEPVVAVEPFLDGGVFERGVEDVYRLVFTRQSAILLWSLAPPASCRRGRRALFSRRAP